MTDLRPRWRSLDAQYVWTWCEALAVLPRELQREVIRSMWQIVYHRYLQLRLASIAAPSGRVEDSWQRARHTDAWFCVATRDRHSLGELVRLLWEDDVVCVSSSINYSHRHETLHLLCRACGDEHTLFVHVAPLDQSRATLRGVVLTPNDDTVWCTYSVDAPVSHHRMPLMQLS